eukprot:1188034-Prorocentrum_minimum.AAC.1
MVYRSSGGRDSTGLPALRPTRQKRGSVGSIRSLIGAFGPISGEAPQNAGRDDDVYDTKPPDFRPVRDSFGT